MRCDEFSARFDELLDERREPLDEPDLADHVARCSECRRMSAAVGVAIGALAELRGTGCGASFDPATDLPLERILAAIRREQAADGVSQSDPSMPALSEPNLSDLTRAVSVPATASRSSAGGLWRGSAFYALLATAATIVLAAYPVWRWNVVPPTADPSNVVAKIDGRSQSGSKLEAPAEGGPELGLSPANGGESEQLPTFTELARESRDSYEQLVRDTGRSLGDALAVADLFSSDGPAYSAGAEPGDDWLNQVESGWEPLKRSTLGTLDVLRQVVPADTETRS